MGSVLFTEISRLCALFSRGDLNHVLTPSQTNVLVNSNGSAYIAGLRAARTPADTTPAVDGYRTFPGIAPELVHPRWSGFHGAVPTMRSDVYAFAVLAWEVRIQQVPSDYKPLSKVVWVVRFSQDELRSPIRASWRDFIR